MTNLSSPRPQPANLAVAGDRIRIHGVTDGFLAIEDVREVDLEGEAWISFTVWPNPVPVEFHGPSGYGGAQWMLAIEIEADRLVEIEAPPFDV